MSYAQHGIRAATTNATETPKLTNGYYGVAVFIIDVPDWKSQTLGYPRVDCVITYDTPYDITSLSARYPGRGSDGVYTNTKNLALRCPSQQAPLFKDTIHGGELAVLPHTRSLRTRMTKTSPMSQVRVISHY